jgi:hypothetical protein
MRQRLRQWQASLIAATPAFALFLLLDAFGMRRW